MLQNHVCTLFNQGFGRVSFLGGIKPRVDPDNFELDIWVHAACVQIGRVDAPDHFGDRERRDVTDDVAFGHLARDMALNGAPFIETRGIGRHVGGCLVARRVLELHIRELLGHVDRRVHEPEGCGEDQVSAIQRHLRDNTFGIWAFGNVFNVNGFNRIAEFRFNGKTALIMFIRPAAIAYGPDIDETHLGFVLGKARCRQPKRHHGTGQKCFQFHSKSPVGFWPLV